MPWSEVVAEIRNGDERHVEALYGAVSLVARIQLLQRVDRQAVDDYVQEVLIIVLQAIRSGDLRDPSCLMGFVRTVARRQVGLHIRDAVARRGRLISVESSTPPAASSREWPDARLAWEEKVLAVQRILANLSPRDREILIRFYFEEQDSRHICREMHLTATQFRLYKSRALAKCEAFTSVQGRYKVRAAQSTRPVRIA